MDLYVVSSAEDSPDCGIGTFVHGVYPTEEEAVARLARFLAEVGYEDLERGTNDMDEDASERYDADGTYAFVNSFGCGLSFEVRVTRFRKRAEEWERSSE